MYEIPEGVRRADQHVLSLSYGKDSLACLGAIEKLGWPLDRIVHAEIWATDTIPAQLPPMVDFKAKADAIIKERWGIDVEHVCATRDGEKLTYEKMFYRVMTKGKHVGSNKGFPMTVGGAGWCKKLKYEDASIKSALSSTPRKFNKTDLRLPDEEGELVQQRSENEGAAPSNEPVFSESPTSRGARKNSVIQYLGIAADEPVRLERLDGVTKISPLAALGWDEAYCRQWCTENDLLSPVYETALRDGCWFCHNQGVQQLRLLRRNYPDLWALLLKWDADSPVTFKADGHTVRDYDRRFLMEDAGLIEPEMRFLWKLIDDSPLSIVTKNKGSV